ncbi:hypothetical protein P3X46_031185 [Hevea brasiliensis]|uniref:Uncharacterized protein n=1 Tax=Hevea brasiliensis TaxID=3981 RepID=A0ABQ9KLD1_HEVBR|nr:uncharacterized protein LOC110650284 [Hevea brasiliensis]XP_021660876.2 uncharacterized protein LOC110650284 [Hevea brasiliensis]XP_021660878.2 uncharacterized protein LOC110650284 [Hevea brasiliensis]KAJ9140552.1 hypothetical protein P3X46_031185 [Hevea brasiliensis]
MGPSELEAKQTSLAIGSEHRSETSEGLKINLATNSIEENHFAHGKKLSSSSSSSSSSSFEDPRLSPRGTASPNDEKGTQLASEENVDGISVSSSPIPRDELHSSNASSLNTELATQSPTTQLMERPANTTASPSYRIPSSIFASKSSAPNDWSVASSESLFSIHMGNMSFTRDEANWLGKSGEIGLIGDHALSGSFSPMFDFSSKRHSSNQSPNNISGEIEQRTEAKMRKNINDNEADAGKQKSPVNKSHRSASLRGSDVSASSVKSFAFPILTGDHKMDFPQKRNASSPMTSNSQPPTPKVALEPDSQQKSQPETPKAPSNAAQGKWYSCLPCCS